MASLLAQELSSAGDSKELDYNHLVHKTFSQAETGEFEELGN